MIEETQEWGDFSEWLNRINDCIEQEQQQETSTPSDSEAESSSTTFSNLLLALQRWVRQIEDAPVTTWKEELSVRGLDFEDFEGDDRQYSEKLWRLIEGLAGMRVYVSNSNHLSDGELYQFLVRQIIDRPIAQVPLHKDLGCDIDIVGLETQEDPINWLQYYASNRERMEWAKQNPGRGLPMTKKAPYDRDNKLPKC